MSYIFFFNTGRIYGTLSTEYPEHKNITNGHFGQTDMLIFGVGIIIFCYTVVLQSVQMKYESMNLTAVNVPAMNQKNVNSEAEILV